MSIFAEMLKPQIRAAESIKSVTSGLSFLGFNGAKSTTASIASSLTLPAFYNAIEILSNDIAQLPKPIFQKEGDSRLKVSHDVVYLLNDRPNKKMSAFTFWKVVEALRLLRGNAFILIERNNNTGRITRFSLLKNEYVQVLEDDEQLYYKYKGGVLYSGDEILHFKAFTIDGKLGVGVVTYAAYNLGVYLDNQSYASDIYKDRGIGYGVIESEHGIIPANKKALSKAFEDKLSQGSKFRVPILDEGMSYKNIQLSPAEAEFLATNKNGVIEVCRWLNIAPHKLKDLANANYSNIYQQSIEHVQHNVVPRVIMYEQELAYKTLTQSEINKGYYFRFNIAVLLRGDLQAKSQFYTSMVYSGIYNRNEVRALEDMNPVAGLDEHLTPVNMELLDFMMKQNKQTLEGNGGE